MEANFLNYIKSIVMQSMIFLGVAPSPITHRIERNLKQAKLLLDTLVMIRVKTKGNLTPQEMEVLDNAVNELKKKYEEIIEEKDDD